MNQTADNLEEFRQAASSDKTMRDEQFIDYCENLVIGVLETIKKLNGTTKPSSCWYFPFNVLRKNYLQNQNQNSLD